MKIKYTNLSPLAVTAWSCCTSTFFVMFARDIQNLYFNNLISGIQIEISTPTYPFDKYLSNFNLPNFKVYKQQELL